MIKKKNVLITGATGSIGQEVANFFDKKKEYNLILTGSKNLSVKRLKKKFKNSSHTFLTIDFLKINKKVLKFLKKEKIDLYINCAGIINRQHFLNEKLSDSQKVLKVNYETPVQISKIILKKMIKQKFGRIIYLNSQMSKLVHPNASSSYSSSKSALQSFTRHAAKNCGFYNININGIMAGTIRSKMQKNFNKKVFQKLIKEIPSNRIGEKKEIAELVYFLCSDKASYINGALINISGGSILD